MAVPADALRAFRPPESPHFNFNYPSLNNSVSVSLSYRCVSSQEVCTERWENDQHPHSQHKPANPSLTLRLILCETLRLETKKKKTSLSLFLSPTLSLSLIYTLTHTHTCKHMHRHKHNSASKLLWGLKLTAWFSFSF